MKQPISKILWSALAITLFCLSGCSGKHEAQGKQLGKKLDNAESTIEKKLNEGKETATNLKEDIEKKAQELHEAAKN